MSWTKTEQTEARQRLLEILKPGDTVYTVLKHVSQSGMTRDIAVYAIKDNQPLWLSYNVAAACDMTFNRKQEAVRIGGCGMDMGFAIVYDLSHVLWPDGFKCLGEGCPHCCDRDGVPTHKDGGYALRHRWIG